MADTFPPKYELTTSPARSTPAATAGSLPETVSRYRPLSSFETSAIAHADGDALEKLIRSSMIGQRAQRFRRAKKN
jgi:hypothetical protein